MTVPDETQAAAFEVVGLDIVIPAPTAGHPQVSKSDAVSASVCWTQAGATSCVHAWAAQ